MAAHSGADALVPPTPPIHWASQKMPYPVLGSALAETSGISASQPPQDTDSVFSALAVANLWKASKKLLGWLGSSGGAWYTSIVVCGASAATISMSSAASPEPTPDPAPPSTAT